MLKIDIHKTYKQEGREIELKFNAQFPEQGVVGIYGTSGIGKSSVLRILAGLELPDKGTISYGDQTWFETEQSNLPNIDRGVGFVFQDYNLFPNMTVRRNLEYANPDGIIPAHISQMLDSSGLNELLTQYPKSLSGGQKQRLSIIRSLCALPKVLLLDEPFSALDDESCATIIQAVKKIRNNFELLVIVVSHRRDVLAAMCDQILHYREQGVLVSYSPDQMKSKGFEIMS